LGEAGGLIFQENEAEKTGERGLRICLKGLGISGKEVFSPV